MKEQYAEIKRRIRKLKKLEITLRSISEDDTRTLVWDTFFNPRGPDGTAKYTLEQLAVMDHDTYHQTVDEFFFHVYYRIHKENGSLLGDGIYDPVLLRQMNLPPDADAAMIRARFRELAKKYHPDVGGDSAAFVALTEQYHTLTARSGVNTLLP